MGLQIHLRLKHDELLFQALLVQAKEVVFLEVILQRIVVDVVLLLAMSGSSIADVASLMPVTAVSIQFVISVKSLATETALWVTSETTLVNGTWDVVSVFLVFPQFRHGKEFMLVGKDLLVSSTKITASSWSFNMRFRGIAH